MSKNAQKQTTSTTGAIGAQHPIQIISGQKPVIKDGPLRFGRMMKIGSQSSDLGHITSLQTINSIAQTKKRMSVNKYKDYEIQTPIDGGTKQTTKTSTIQSQGSASNKNRVIIHEGNVP